MQALLNVKEKEYNQLQASLKDSELQNRRNQTMQTYDTIKGQMAERESHKLKESLDKSSRV